jgi:phosphatidate cytidylyltransferase
MLHWRLILGTLFIAALAAFCWLDYVVTRPGAFLLPVAAMLSWVCVVELLEIFNKRGRQPLPWAMFSGALLCVACAGLPVLWLQAAQINPPGALGWLMIGVTLGLLMSVVGEVVRYDGRWHSTINLGLEAFSILYAGAMMGFIIQLRLLNGGPWGKDGRWGMLALLSLIVTVKMSDIGQYAVGRLIGRHKLAPNVSPGKTWEGAAGGIVFAIAAAWIVFGWGAQQIIGPKAPPPQWWSVGIFAVAVAVAGMIGDLAESVLKRDAQVKDSSTWMPGFGGVLDLLDSLLGAAPVAYLLWLARLVGP